MGFFRAPRAKDWIPACAGMTIHELTTRKPKLQIVAPSFFSQSSGGPRTLMAVPNTWVS